MHFTFLEKLQDLIIIVYNFRGEVGVGQWFLIRRRKEFLQ